MTDIPAHVPPDLVHDISRYLAPNDRDDPFSLTENIYEELPRVFFSAGRLSALNNGVWVVTRHADIREVYQSDALYSTADAANFQALIVEFLAQAL